MKYYTLVASLPALPAHFDVERTPITRPRLSQLLKQLTDKDADTIHQLASFFSWDRQLVSWSDDDIQHRYEELMENPDPLIREIVNLRINVRTIVAAIRRRHDNLGPPTAAGELVAPIQRHWAESTFGLGRRYRWIESFTEQMDRGNIVAADRILLEFTWQTWSRLAARYTFSFEAIPLYVARWEIIDRWTSQDAANGRVRFDQLTQEALGDYAVLKF
ncbi:MAG: hypothetical protein CL946_12755 [Ectothiorhodospiraceae bacterium]|nr:hypothetical protein [Ectothiorhodospiraceae bacterium]